MLYEAVARTEPGAVIRWPEIGASTEPSAWLQLQVDLGLAPLTVEAYARGLSSFLLFCRDAGVDPLGPVRRITSSAGFVR